ncbi:MAG: phosphotransferase, partial [Gammaproteobacteria bacterium]|nr:phosphotransferase [Gammaproteobacteria bacterium]
ELDRGTDWPFLDGLLNAGWRLSGYASDDAHFWIDDCFGGWVWVQADHLEPAALLDSLKQGRYYSSQGPVLHNVEVRDGTVEVECSPARNVAITGRGAKSETVRGNGLTHCELPVRRFQGSWFRITVIDAAGRRAWTNPVWLD